MKHELLSKFELSNLNFPDDESNEDGEHDTTLEKPDPFDLYGQKVPGQDPSRTSADTIEHDDSD